MGALDPNAGLNRLTKREWNLHRVGLTAADPAGIIAGSTAGYSRTAGIRGDGYRKVMIDVNTEIGTVTSVALEVLYWSEDKASWVSDNPAATQTINGGSGQFSVEHGGRDFLIALRTITGAAGGAKTNISVRGSWPDNSENA